MTTYIIYFFFLYHLLDKKTCRRPELYINIIQLFINRLSYNIKMYNYDIFIELI